VSIDAEINALTAADNGHNLPGDAAAAVAACPFVFRPNDRPKHANHIFTPEPFNDLDLWPFSWSVTGW